jgi:hypothetical protein
MEIEKQDVMAHHPGPREARPECKLRVGHPVGFAILLRVKRWCHLDGPHSRAMTSFFDAIQIKDFEQPD